MFPLTSDIDYFDLLRLAEPRLPATRSGFWFDCMARFRAVTSAGPSVRSSDLWCSDNSRKTLSPFAVSSSSHLTTVLSFAAPPNVAVCGQPVCQLYRAMVLNLHPLGHPRDPLANALGNTLQCQHA